MWLSSSCVFDRSPPPSSDVQNICVPAVLRVMNCGIRLVAVQVKHPAALEMQNGEGVQIIVVPATNDRPLAIIRHDERQGRCSDFPGVNWYAVSGGHIQKHAAEPIIGDGRQDIGWNAQLCAAERRRYRISTERNGVGRSDVLLVADRYSIG